MNMCTICGKAMKFIEGDVLHDEKWYHGICLKIKKSADVCVQRNPMKKLG